MIGAYSNKVTLSGGNNIIPDLAYLCDMQLLSKSDSLIIIFVFY
jgi:hypothetical protein